MISATKRRFSDYNRLKGKKSLPGEFWDVVVLTAADDLQKEAYEFQLKTKLDDNRFPLSADYIVVADPPGYKIGNGGSTLVVLEVLHEKYGDLFIKKKIMVVHAGGFSQRLPNASVFGKAFIAMPMHEPVFEMLDMKLASYIDFPGKIEGGGMFVCCSDTLETYNDGDVGWKFPTTGITGLAHPSSLKIGTTHGVYLLKKGSYGDAENNFLLKQCRKFLHKPSVEKMRNSEGCVQLIVSETGSEEVVLTDSAFFISEEVCLKLLSFYQSHKPLKCEIDAYGDFLQSLGTEADDSYVSNVSNVVSAVNDLAETRKKVNNLLCGTSLHVVALVPDSSNPSTNQANIDSKFYHFGTTEEYLHLLTEDKELANMLGLEPTAFCTGLPFAYTPKNKSTDTIGESVFVPVVSGLMGTAVKSGQVKSVPIVMASVILAQVRIGERSVLDYCRLRERVSIGHTCIVSNCSLLPHSKVPPETFLHTVAVDAAKLGYGCSVGYTTVAFGINDNMKLSCRRTDAGQIIKFFGIPLADLFQNSDDVFPNFSDDDQVSLWSAKLFPVFKSMEESSERACEELQEYLNSITSGSKCTLRSTKFSRLSMADILMYKSVKQMIRYRNDLEKEIMRSRREQTSIPRWVG